MTGALTGYAAAIGAVEQPSALAAEGTLRNPTVVEQELYEGKLRDLVTTHDDALERPTQYANSTVLSQEVWAVLAPMFSKPEGAGD